VELRKEAERSRGDGRGSGTLRLTAGQALLRFLAAQFVERDGVEQRFFGGCFGIFGHGNVAGFGQALHQHPELLTYYQARNEQAMVHTAVGYARMRNRLGALACTTSIGPGATNMVTGAALATINRIPVLLLPGDIFATRRAEPVLQQLEDPSRGDVSVNDCFIPVSRYFDRVWRPEQLAPSLLAAMRVLTSPAETGAVTLALPQDVQAEAADWPEELFERRVWHIPRSRPDAEALARVAAAIRGARRPLLVAGGGVVYSDATTRLERFVDATGIPVAVTQAGKGALAHGHPLLLGPVGASGSLAANRLAHEADLVLGVGTRWTDFTTASNTAFPSARFVSLNVEVADAAKRGLMLVADARVGLEELTRALAGWAVDDAYRSQAVGLVAEWDEEVSRLYGLGHGPLPAQSEVIGAVNDATGDDGVVVCAAGSMPGDLVKLWRTADPQSYHVEYGYSCMGYEIAGGLGVKLAAPERDVYVLVGDGSYLMLAQEIATAVQEGLKLTIVIVDNHGFSSIGGLSRSVGAHGFGTRFRLRSGGSLGTDDDAAPVSYLPVDLAANAASLGARVFTARTIEEFRAALADSRSEQGAVAIHVEVDRYESVPGYDSWWDVPVAEVADVPEVLAARAEYERRIRDQQRPL
jgi:3D-(3,5/4)-trihydroxycyclohexane-1,2-dione acylhydrolase (decyclizing)